MWDLSAHNERLMNQRSNKQEKKKNTLNTLPGTLVCGRRALTRSCLAYEQITLVK